MSEEIKPEGEPWWRMCPERVRWARGVIAEADHRIGKNPDATMMRLRVALTEALYTIETERQERSAQLQQALGNVESLSISVSRLQQENAALINEHSRHPHVPES